MILKLLRPLAVIISGTVFTLAPGANAQTCPCNYMVCAICVESSLPAIKVATEAAFNSLSTLHRTMDGTIDLGVQAEVQAIDLYKSNIVAAIEADTMSMSTSMEIKGTAEARLLQGLKESMESTQKTAMVARANLESAQQYGVENVSYATKAVSNSQYASVTHKSPIDTFSDDGSVKADIAFLIATSSNRRVQFANSLLEPMASDSTKFQMINLLNSIEGVDYKADVIAEENWAEALTYRKFLAVPGEVQSGLRDIDLRTSNDQDYAPIRARSKLASEFLAWELALKSEVVTDAGPTSFYDFIKSHVTNVYESTNGMIDEATGGEREVTNSIATNEAIGTVLDMLLLEVMSYNLQMEAAKLGSLNDEKYNSNYGYQQINTSNNVIKRGNAGGR